MKSSNFKFEILSKTDDDLYKALDIVFEGNSTKSLYWLDKNGYLSFYWYQIEDSVKFLGKPTLDNIYSSCLAWLEEALVPKKESRYEPDGSITSKGFLLTTEFPKDAYCHRPEYLICVLSKQELYYAK